mmetsp:Transcript_73390/g.123621  ORF Transcript_73390/g.123621 Transcript_73390/m.123621 type:complete len:89 (-) Transcript_73390:1779-2045(-)
MGLLLKNAQKAADPSANAVDYLPTAAGQRPTAGGASAALKLATAGAQLCRKMKQPEATNCKAHQHRYARRALHSVECDPARGQRPKYN